MKIGREREVLNRQLSTGEIERVEDFKYLRVNIGERGKTEKVCKRTNGNGTKSI